MDVQAWLSELSEQYGPDRIKNAFYAGQVVLGGLFVAGLLWARGKPAQSGFKDSSSDPARPAAPPAAKPRLRRPGEKDPLADARIPRQQPLRLTGIRIDGPPHETLGVAPGAGEAEIQKAYRELMKQYHPDRVGRQGTREWNDAQKIAEAINRAKDEMIRRARARR